MCDKRVWRGECSDACRRALERADPSVGRRVGMPVLIMLGLFAAVASGAMPLPPASQTAATGVIVGKVRLGGTSSRQPPPLGPYSRRRAVPPRTTESGAQPGDAVVFARPADPPARLAARTARITQRDRTIRPFATVVTVGTRVDFPNEDEVFHNLFSLSEPNRFDLGRYAPGESRSRVFDRPGMVRVFCDIHADMSAVVFVVDTPYHVQPMPDGTYVFTDLPAGSYTLAAWHAGSRADSVQIVVTAGDTVRVDFSLR